MAGKDADIDIVGQRHGGFYAISVGLDLANLDVENDLVLTGRGPVRNGGNCLIVIKDDAVESVVDQIPKLGRRLSVERVDQHAGIGVWLIGGTVRAVRGVYLIVRVGIAVLHQEVPEGVVYLVLPYIVGEGIHDLSTLLVPHVGLALDQSEWRATRAPVEFRPVSGSGTSVVMPDFVTGRFRAWLPQGRYTVSQGVVHLTLRLIPGAMRRVDLRPAQAVDFSLSSEARGGGVVTLRLTAEGAGRHAFILRAFNLDVRDPEKAIVLEPGKTTSVVWQATLKSLDVPWVAVAFPDGDLSQRQETTGLQPK